MSMHIDKAELVSNGLSRKIEEFLRSKIKIESEFECIQAHIVEIAVNYWQLIAFVFPVNWPTKLYRVDVLYRESVFHGAVDFKATLSEVTEL
ncbi:hypothetical protein PP939_gp262 [Rhizobium phage RL38J1]|uniref:Uncharacterized protein n=1 Tax=Rhizobium phage RL38J1 TaxID=2663232 RepID=A0A6B9J2Z2_9CAUD|nr:hypothetical protein PP939_gp262 [Rhizobium phage RL38J1]QGZ14003.1 hypothetical protein RL38J1_262 [Rhizobium phage RL38J1]